MSNNFFFKIYLPIYRSTNKICLGQVGKNDNYLELDYNETNLTLIENILTNGFESDKTNLFPFSLFVEKNLVEIKNSKYEDTSRSNLFLEYLYGNQRILNEDLFKKKILIFGAGAGGSTLCYLLAQFGFKNLYIIDDDIVNESDLHRVLTFDKSNIGEFKVKVLKEKIKSNFNITLKIKNKNFIEYEELNDIISQYSPDLIVKACDPKGIFISNLNKICFEKKIPFILMAYSFENAKIGPFFIPGITSCYQSFSDFSVRLFGEHYKIENFERLFQNFIFHPSISFNINILSSFIFKEILFFLLEKYEQCETIGKLIILNSLKIKTDSYLIKCIETCEICNEKH